MESKPNIVIIFTDQQRADLRAGEGFPCDTMPFLDQMALSGCDFRKAYTPTPICMPTRCSLFTGRWPSALHITSNQSDLQNIYYKTDLIEVLRKSGYMTALCGKNHSYLRPTDFDHYFQAEHGGGSGPDRNEKELLFDQYLTALRHRTDFDPSPYGIEAQCPYRDVSDAIDWIDSIGSKPFFLWLTFAEPHNPYQVPEPYFSMFEDAPAPSTGKQALAKKGFKFRWLRESWEKVCPDLDKEVDRGRKNYLGMLRLIDDQLRRFHEALSERGLTENTCVFFASDHGDFVGEYGLPRKGAELSEPLCRVPFIVNGPVVRKSGAITGAAVSLIDIFPTICEMIGFPIPEGVQGRSLMPLLTGDDYPSEEFSSIYAEHGFGGLYFTGKEPLGLEEEGAINDGCTFDELNTWTQSGTARMVVEGDYKLILDMVGNGQLYNIKIDPTELNDLYDIRDHTTVRDRLLSRMSMWQMRAADDCIYPAQRYHFKKHPRNYQWGANESETQVIPPAHGPRNR